MNRVLVTGLIHSLDLVGGSAVQLGRSLRERWARWSGFTSEVIRVGHHHIHHWHGGDGPTVLLIHGFGAGGLPTWLPVARQLARTHRVIIPDLLWFGGSTSDAEPSLDAQAEAIRALIDHCVSADESVHIVGSSYGGFVALRYGSLAPSRQGRLVIMGSPGPFFGMEDQAALLERFGVDALEEIFVPSRPEDVETLIGLAYHHPPPLPAPLLRDLYTHVFSAHSEEKTALLKELEREHERYHAMTLATYAGAMVIWGAHDRVFPAANGEALAAHLNAEYRVIDDTSHAPHLERPNAVTPLLSAFLSP